MNEQAYARGPNKGGKNTTPDLFTDEIKGSGLGTSKVKPKMPSRP